MQTTDSSFSAPPHALTQTCAHARSQRGLTRSAALIAISTLVASFAVAAKAPYHAAARPIKDDQGRVQVIIDFTDDAHENFPADTPPRSNANVAASGDVKFFHHPKVLKLVEHYEKKYGFVRSGMTSWVGNSVTAFLSPQQISEIRDDHLVAAAWDSESVALSAPPPWYDTTVNGETLSWGRNAVNGKTKLGGSARRVYVIDGGVAEHYDFLRPDASSNVTRVTVACGNTAGGCESLVDGFPPNNPITYPKVGCYGHATHVAGIIGALTNSQGVAGVYAGVDIVSVNVTYAVNPHATGVDSPAGNGGIYGWCSDSLIQTASIGYGLDYVYFDTLNNNSGRVTVVNLSMNPGAMGWYWDSAYGSYRPETNYPKVRALATPGLAKDGRAYQGAFVAQAAGNYGASSCGWLSSTQSYSYRLNPALYPYATDATDGIMVVGAVHNTGAAVSASVGFSASSPPYQATTEPYSNYGQCVDVWAPGNSIISLWGDYMPAPPTFVPSTRVGTKYSASAYLSGTSMASPHVAAAAAYLADYFSLTSPAAIEAKVRRYMVNYGYDQAYSPVNVIQLP
jgi:hypothetical protein